MASGESDVNQQDTEANGAGSLEYEARKEAVSNALRTFFQAEELETRRQRERFAARCGTSWNHLLQLMQGTRHVAPWLAVNLDRESNGQLDMTALTVEPNPKHSFDWDHVRRVMRRKPKV